jgi:hypothetical protein
VTDIDEPLESGYGARTLPGDNLCNDFQQETAHSYAELARARGDRLERIDGELTLTDAALGLPFWNRAVVEQPIVDAGTVLARCRAFYDGHAAVPFLLDSAWPTPDLRDNGFMLMGHPPLMVRPARRPLPPAPTELRIERVEDIDRAADLERTLIDGYPAPQFQPFEAVQLFTPSAFDAAGWHHFVGYIGDRPVAAGSSYLGERLLRVENIATLGDERGKGYGAALTAAAIGVDESKPAVLVASDLGRPVYERLGFEAVLRVTYWVGMRQ